MEAGDSLWGPLKGVAERRGNTKQMLRHPACPNFSTYNKLTLIQTFQVMCLGSAYFILGNVCQCKAPLQTFCLGFGALLPMYIALTTRIWISGCYCC